jgi:two-component system sensor histidine kinase UhpB
MDQSKKELSVLIVEDNPADKLLLQESLNTTTLRIGDVKTAETIKEAILLLEEYSFSIIFLDLFLPDSVGLETLTKLAQQYIKSPIIISSGVSDAQVAVKAISLGAQDFLIKGDYTPELLEKTVSYSIQRKESEQLLKSSEESYRYLFDNNPAAIFIWDSNTFQILEVNEASVKLYGYTKEEFLQKTLLDIRSQDERENFIIAVSKLKKEKKESGIWRHFTNEGKVLIMDISSHLIFYHDKQVVLTMANDITERILLEEKLAKEEIKKQQEIHAAIITAQAQERSFLGEELHDNVNQILATARLYIDSAINNEESRIDLLTEGKKMVKHAIGEIRDLSKRLLLPSFVESGLKESLTDLVDKIKHVNESICFVIDWRLTDEKSLTEKLKFTIYRIVQEQLNNIFKHAKASKVIITLQQKAGMLLLSIQDDGIGFDQAKKRDGVGLLNIKSRAELLNGNVLINSQPGEGCKLEINFNCPCNFQDQGSKVTQSMQILNPV